MKNAFSRSFLSLCRKYRAAIPAEPEPAQTPKKGMVIKVAKVLKAQKSKDNSTRYSLIESEIQFDGKKILTYGIRIESLSSGEGSGQEVKSEILDITTKYEKAIALYNKIVKLDISPMILKDVAEDFIVS